MKRNQDYKNAALAALKGNWEQSIVVAFVVVVLSELLTLSAWGFSLLQFDADQWSGPVFTSAFILVIVSYLLFLVYPVVVGLANVFNRLYFESDRRLLGNLNRLSFRGFSRSGVTMFLMSLVTSFFSLLILVPGIIASLSLFLTPYLLKDYPKLSAIEVLRLSHKMMKGYRMQLFKLQLSFMGWIVLNVFTLGIGTLWLVPYMMTTMAVFYQDVKAEYLKKEGLQESAL